MKVRIILAISATLILSLFFACNKDGEFIGTNEFNSEIQLFALTSSNDAYVKIQIGDTTFKKLELNNSGLLEDPLRYVMKTPPSSQVKVKIWWKNTNQIITDTVISAGAITRLYLIQLDPTTPHKFYTNFGGDAPALTDTTKVNVRILYSKDTSLKYPDTVRLVFSPLFEVGNEYSDVDSLHRDTVSITVINGQVSDYIQLYDYAAKIKDPITSILYGIQYGYEIYNVNTGQKLESYCYNTLPVNIAYFPSREESTGIIGDAHTMRLGYISADDLGYKCSNVGNATPAPTYDLKRLFGNGTIQAQ